MCGQITSGARRRRDTTRSEQVIWYTPRFHCPSWRRQRLWWICQTIGTVHDQIYLILHWLCAATNSMDGCLVKAAGCGQPIATFKFSCAGQVFRVREYLLWNSGTFNNRISGISTDLCLKLTCNRAIQILIEYCTKTNVQDKSTIYVFLLIYSIFRNYFGTRKVLLNWIIRIDHSYTFYLGKFAFHVRN